MSDESGREVAVEVEGGHVHRGFNRHGVLFVDEGCNVDDAAHRRQLSAEEFSRVEAWRLCQRKGCYPSPEPDPAA